MKTALIRNNVSVPRYPAAADRRYYLNKLLDGLLVVATSVGAFVAFAFLVLL